MPRKLKYQKPLLQKHPTKSEMHSKYIVFKRDQREYNRICGSESLVDVTKRVQLAIMENPNCSYYIMQTISVCHGEVTPYDYYKEGREDA